MKGEDRQQALRFLAEGLKALEEAAAGLTEDQAHRVPASGWTAFAIVEHVAVAEPHLLGLVKAGRPMADRPGADPAKDAVLVDRVIGRARRVQAPEGLSPTGRWATIAEALEAFRLARAATVAFVETCERDLRNEHTEHPILGLIPSYSCLLLAAAHPARHAAQIRELLASGESDFGIQTADPRPVA